MLETIKYSDYAEYTMGGISLLVLDVNLYSGCLKQFWSSVTYLALEVPACREGCLGREGRRQEDNLSTSSMDRIKILKVESGSYSR